LEQRPAGRATDGAESLPQVREAGVRNRNRPRLKRRATRLLAIGRAAVDAIAGLVGGRRDCDCPRCNTSTPPVATIRVEPVGRDECRSRSSRYCGESTESSATERAGKPLSGTQGRGAHSLTIRRAIASSSSSVRARWRRRSRGRTVQSPGARRARVLDLGHGRTTSASSNATRPCT
jgi:hypothetical protein